MILTKTKYPLFILFLLLCVTANAQWQISGGKYPPYVFEPSVASGLDGVWMLYGMEDATIVYQAREDAPISCYRFVRGIETAEPVEGTQQGSEFRIVSPQAGSGYFLKQNDQILSGIWLIDYTLYPLTMNSLTVDVDASDCDNTRLLFDREDTDLIFFWSNGRPETIAREYIITYPTLVWNAEKLDYEEVLSAQQTVGYREMNVDAPLCNTQFTITGDQFLDNWGIARSVTSPLYEAKAVSGEAFAEQHVRDGGNEIDKVTGELGGSAPVDITFTGYANYPVTTYQAWEISFDPEFNILEATYPDRDLSYSFETEGSTYVRFVVSNSDNSCEKVIRNFTVNTSESSLKVPNVFTPQSTSGNNQIFKVAYKSIIRFDARVFNRWGNQLYHWTNPAEGWDGMVNGKPVPTGAYYYIIEAEGVGGKKYKLKGDINVLRSKN